MYRCTSHLPLCFTPPLPPLCVFLLGRWRISTSVRKYLGDGWAVAVTCLWRWRVCLQSHTGPRWDGSGGEVSAAETTLPGGGRTENEPGWQVSVIRSTLHCFHTARYEGLERLQSAESNTTNLRTKDYSSTPLHYGTSFLVHACCQRLSGGN